MKALACVFSGLDAFNSLVILDIGTSDAVLIESHLCVTILYGRVMRNDSLRKAEYKVGSYPFHTTHGRD
jgi:hypothetical protein